MKMSTDPGSGNRTFTNKKKTTFKKLGEHLEHLEKGRGKEKTYK
jgi:hypothetical protein